MVNFPQLNGVLGITGEPVEESDSNPAKYMNALFLIQWNTCSENVAERKPCLRKLIDFGPDELSAERKSNAQQALPLADINGAGVAEPENGSWERERYANGKEDEGENYILKIPLDQLIRGAVSKAGNTIQDIPNVNAEIDLGRLVNKYWTFRRPAATLD